MDIALIYLFYFWIDRANLGKGVLIILGCILETGSDRCFTFSIFSSTSLGETNLICAG